MLTANPLKTTLDELLERAAAEKDRERFLTILQEIGRLRLGRSEQARSLKTVNARPPSMETDTFDIFAGPPDRNAVWRESIRGIERARRRMEELAASTPGDYFIFHERSHAVLAKTGKGPSRAEAPRVLPPIAIKVS